jgi:hypothetical protein
VNEVTTIAAAYAIAGYAVDATHVSSSGTSLAQTGIANAFANADNLASISSGVALTMIPSGNATVPQTTINTLANILAACVHSAGASSAGCAILFSNTTVGTNAPTDTATAAINIVHDPLANVAELYTLQGSESPYSPILGTVPNDFAVTLTFSSVAPGGFSGQIAVDGEGNVWLDSGLYSIVEVSSSGYVLSGADGYGSNDGMVGPGGVAIDPYGNTWVGNAGVLIPSSSNPNGLLEFSSAGTLLSIPGGYTGGGINSPRYIAIDGAGNVWAGNEDGYGVSEFSNAGVSLSGTGPFTGGYPVQMNTIAIDSQGDVWTGHTEVNGFSEFSNSGVLLSGAHGFAAGEYGSPAGIAVDASDNVWGAYPGGNEIVELANDGTILKKIEATNADPFSKSYNLSIDGDGNVWAASNVESSSITEITNSGEVLSGTNGITSPGLNFSYAIAVDGSGDVWVANGKLVGSTAVYYVTETIGIAAPVVTPLSVGVKNHMLGTRP